MSHRIDPATPVIPTKPNTGQRSARPDARQNADGTAQIVARGWSWNSLAYLYALILSAAVGYSLIHVPFQVSDNLGNLIALQDGRSMWQLFLDTLTLQGFMRPASWVTTKAVFDLAGGHYFVAYRTLHIVMVLLLTCALVRLVRVRSSLTCCLAVLSTAALIGFHPFHDAVRETELNMKLLLPLVCMTALVLADSRHQWWKDVVAVLLTAYGLMANELGILVWVTLVAGYLVGLRGISGRALIIASALLGFYFVFRFGMSPVGSPGLAERSSGFGLRSREPDELVAMFGNNPLPFYLYNVVASALTVLLSEPRGGVFVLVRYFFSSSLDPGTVINVATSLVTTLVMCWYAGKRWRMWLSRDFSHEDRLFLVTVAVVAGNAAISFPYTKDVIMSIGAAFYPLAMFAALRLLLTTVGDRRMGDLRAAAVYLVIGAISVGWTLRAASFFIDMRQSAYKAQADWVDVYAWLEEQKILQPGEKSALVDQLRGEMLGMQVPRVYRDSPWLARMDPH